MSVRFNNRELQRDIAAAGHDLKRLRKIAQAVIDLAMQGDVGAVNHIADSIDGPAPVQRPRHEEQAQCRL